MNGVVPRQPCGDCMAAAVHRQSLHRRRHAHAAYHVIFFQLVHRPLPMMEVQSRAFAISFRSLPLISRERRLRTRDDAHIAFRFPNDGLMSMPTQ